MALNPQLVTSPNGQVLPARFEGETSVLRRDHIEIEVDGLPNARKKWKSKGSLYLSDVRIVFIADRASGGDMQAFDLPLVYIHKDEVKQPILGCNHLAGLVWPACLGGGPAGSFPPLKFKLYFVRGGVGTFLRLYFHLLHNARISAQWQRTTSQDQPPPWSQSQSQPHPSAPVADLVSTAFIDPSDPTTLFLTQPIPDANTVPAPQYNQTYQMPTV